jgi:hypothetical protein
MRAILLIFLGSALLLLLFSCSSVPAPASDPASAPGGALGQSQASGEASTSAQGQDSPESQASGPPPERDQDQPVIASFSERPGQQRKAPAESAVPEELHPATLPLPELPLQGPPPSELPPSPGDVPVAELQHPLPELPPSPAAFSAVEILVYPPPVIVDRQGRRLDAEKVSSSPVSAETGEGDAPPGRENPSSSENLPAASSSEARQNQPPLQRESAPPREARSSQGASRPQADSRPQEDKPQGALRPQEDRPQDAAPQENAVSRPAESGELIEAVVGEDLTITLDGGGWLFLGSERADPDRPSATVRFLDRTFASGKSRFLFSLSSEGETLLRFQSQDTSAGTSRTQVYRIDVALPAGDTAPGETAAGSAETEPAALQKGLPEESGVSAADLTALLERYRGGERRESLMELSGLLEQWDGLHSLGLAEFPLMPSPGREELPSFYLSSSFPELLYGKKSDFSKMEIIHFLEWLLPAVPENQLDSFYFRLGMLYEEDPPPKDPARAVSFYEKIRLNLPWSRYWTEAAQRERYLRRHFLEFR